MVAPPFNGLLCGKFVHANVPPSEHFVQPKDVGVGASVGAAGVGAAGVGAAGVGAAGVGAAVIAVGFDKSPNNPVAGAAVFAIDIAPDLPAF
jgi:hypothetical protein